MGISIATIQMRIQAIPGGDNVGADYLSRFENE